MTKKFRIVFVLVLSSITFCSILCSCGKPSASPIEDFTYEFKDGETVITGYNGSDLEIVVPDIIDDRAVTVIGEEAFSGYDMTSIYLPESVVKIENESFYECKNLKSIYIPNTVTELGIRCFCKCESLESIILSNRLKVIDDFCFSSCRSLEIITIPDTVTEIGTNAFISCESLKTVTMSDALLESEKENFINHPVISGDINFGIFAECPKLVINGKSVNEYDY